MIAQRTLVCALPMNASPFLKQFDPRPAYRFPAFAPWLALAFFAVAALRCAWMSDDSYVTLRTVDNIIQGYGPIWNPGERVQAYTHPLWMMVLTMVYAITRDAFAPTMVVSVAISTLAVGYGARKLGGRGGYAVLFIVMAVMSRSFVDYSTSGLENPLSHLLIALLFSAYLRYDGSEEQLTWCIVWAALLMLNRLDLALLAVPPVVDLVWRQPWRRSARALLVGASPLILWELFSLVYYGSLVPNTALAKLDNGLEAHRVWRQGGVYLLHQIEFDPLSLAVFLAAFVIGISQVRRHWPLAVLASGVFMYTVYVCKVGGDFMAGRFFSAPYMAGICIIVAFLARRRGAGQLEDSSADLRERDEWAWGAVFVVAVGCLAETPGPSAGSLTAVIGPSGIVDERQFWGLGHHLMGIQSEGKAPYHGVTADGRHVRRSDEKVVVRQAVGAFGFHAGPKVYVVDRYALGDAFLARLPVAKVGAYARPGHNPRFAPPGYVTSLRSGEYKLLDPKLDELWAKIRLVNSGPLFTAERWSAIWELVTGQAHERIDRDFYARPFYNEIPLWVFEGDPKHDGYGWDQPGVVYVEPKKGLEIVLEDVSHAKRIKVLADHNDRYTLRFLHDGESVGKASVTKVVDPARVNLQTRIVTVPDGVHQRGFDALVFEPRKKSDYGLSIGSVELLGE